jgi:rhodanese-related sulfurtransferase
MTTTAGYAGDVDPKTAWAALQRDGRAVLVDVRTQAEWAFVGTPDLASLKRQPVLVEWQAYPAMGANPRFLDELQAAGVGPGRPVYFLCRSGARSRAAAIAATKAGLGPCYNISGGFEGDRDAQSRRGSIGGWKVAGLPWRQD